MKLRVTCAASSESRSALELMSILTEGDGAKPTASQSTSDNFAGQDNLVETSTRSISLRESCRGDVSSGNNEV